MKKLILSLMVMAITAATAMGQRVINESYDLQSIKKLDLQFEYPQLVKVKVWDKAEVKIEGTVDIQAGAYDDDFELRTSRTGDRFKLESKIKNQNKWRGNIIYHDSDDDDDDDNDDDDDDKGTTMVRSGNGTTVITGSRGKRTVRDGVYIDIELTITIPKNMDVWLDARYGIVEILESPNQLEVDARYGGVDVTVNETTLRELNAQTMWGQIFSDLKIPVKVGGDDMIGEWMKARVSTQKGSQRMKVESEYGNVYLRKN